MAAQEALIAMMTCVCRGVGGVGSVSTGNVSHPAEKKQIFPTPCDGWHHGGGLCILSPLEAASRLLNLHWGLGGGLVRGRG